MEQTGKRTVYYKQRKPNQTKPTNSCYWTNALSREQGSFL